MSLLMSSPPADGLRSRPKRVENGQNETGALQFIESQSVRKLPPGFPQLAKWFFTLLKPFS